MMSASSVRTIFTHIDGSDDLVRSVDVYSQIKAEVSVAMDLKIAFARRHIFLGVLREYNISEACWSARSQIKKLFDEDSPLFIHFERIAVGSNARAFLDNMGLIQNDILRQSFVRANFVLNKFVRFGFIPSALFRPDVHNWAREEVEALAEDSQPILDNNGDRDDALVVDLGMIRYMLPGGDAMFNLRTMSQEHGVIIKATLPFDVTVAEALRSSGGCFKIKYVGEGMFFNERNSFELSTLNKADIFVNQNQLMRIDSILGELNDFETFHVNAEEIDMFLLPWERFRELLPQLLTAARVLRNKNVYVLFSGKTGDELKDERIGFILK
jgi:hypothetical protein